MMICPVLDFLANLEEGGDEAGRMQLQGLTALMKFEDDSRERCESAVI